jgi:hypothetical protein
VLGPLPSGWRFKARLVALAGVVAMLACSPAGFALANPPHGRWVLTAGEEVLDCDLSYYATGSSCVQPLAFERQTGRLDRLPDAVAAAYAPGARASRMVGQSRDRSGREWRLYLAIGSAAQDPTGDPCLEVSVGAEYWGGICVDGANLVSAGFGLEWLMGERQLVGIAPNGVDQVDVVPTKGPPKPVELSPDHGFIYFCRSSCACEIRSIVSRAGGRVVSADRLVDPTTRRLSWCE